MKIGDKVVCVDDSPCKCGCGTIFPIVKGSIYIIESFKTLANSGELALRLIRVIRPPNSRHLSDITLRASRFRLLDHLKEQSCLVHEASQQIR